MLTGSLAAAEAINIDSQLANSRDTVLVVSNFTCISKDKAQKGQHNQGLICSSVLLLLLPVLKAYLPLNKTGVLLNIPAFINHPENLQLSIKSHCNMQICTNKALTLAINHTVTNSQHPVPPFHALHSSAPSPLTDAWNVLCMRPHIA